MIDQNSKSSFIPKDQTFSGGKSEYYNLFAISGVAIFSITLFVSLVFFGYDYYLDVKLTQLEDSLRQPEEVFDPDFMDEILLVDSRIRVTESLLENKTSPTFIFGTLEEVTTEDIYFSDFSYVSHLTGEKDLTKVTLKASAPDFNSAAFQSDVFKDSDEIETVEVKNIRLNEGEVTLDFVLGFKERTLLYKENI